MWVPKFAGALICGTVSTLLNTTLLTEMTYFYHTMLCIHGTSHGPVSISVCPSVTSWCFAETAERIELVFGM